MVFRAFLRVALLLKIVKNETVKKESPCIFNSQFITASPFIQSDCSVYWSAGNFQGSLFLFLCMLSQIRDVLKLDTHLPKKNSFTCFNESCLKTMNVFCFISEALFFLKIYTFLSSLFWLCRKTA